MIKWPIIQFFKDPPPAVETATPPEKPKGTLRVSDNFSVDLAAYKATGERDAILASSGMGKSYLTGVIAEETLEGDGLVCVIDPEGEHHTLASRYPMLVIGGEHGIPFDPEKVQTYVNTILEDGISAVFDLSEHIDAVQKEHYTVITDALFHAEQDHKRKIRLIVEEAQIYAPQHGGMKASELNSLSVSQNIAKRGRKRALDSLWATQRPASISKDILSQCNRFWFGGIQAEQDYKAIKSFLDEAGISFDQVRSLQPGEFYHFAQGRTKRLQVRKRFCKHGGSTPVKVDNRPLASKPDVKQIAESLVRAPCNNM